jgi:hypothetical protein
VKVFIKKPLRILFIKFVRPLFRYVYPPIADGIIITQEVLNRRSVDPHSFDFMKLKTQVRGFNQGLVGGAFFPPGRFSKASRDYNLYSSSYIVMTHSLLGDADELSSEERARWIEYFDSYQEPNGYFVDEACTNPNYFQSDWWGARHLALHLVSAYRALNATPQYQFGFLEEWYGEGIGKLLAELDSLEDPFSSDIDNKIMNIACLLQFQRDNVGDKNAELALERLKEGLLARRDVETSLWYSSHTYDANRLSREIQFAYHLLQPFFYDGYFDFNISKVVERTLKTQNRYGGFGVRLNSSACEDIDSVDLLIRLSPFATDQLREKIQNSLERAFGWVLKNQMPDGGFVFRRNERFIFGHPSLRSGINQSNAMATWFRLLSLVYISRFYGVGEHFTLTRAPGYEH